MGSEVDLYTVNESGSLKITVDHGSRAVIHQGDGVHLKVTVDHESEAVVLQPGDAKPGTVLVNEWHGSRVRVEQGSLL